MTKRQKRANLIAILIGVVATTAVAAAYVGGALERLELITLDLRFRYANSLTPSDKIVCLDITDRDLDVIGRWPWSRDLQAPLIAIPAEFDASAILVDLTWIEPETLRSEEPDGADITADPAKLAREAPPDRVFPDLVLSHAIATAGNVYLAYHHSVVNLEHSADFHRIVDLIRDSNPAAARRLAAEIDENLREQIDSDEDYALQRPFDRARMAAALLDDPRIEQQQLADLLDIRDARFLERSYDRCRLAALRRRLVDWLDAEPARWKSNPYELIAVFYATLTDADFSGDNSLKRVVIRAYREVLSYAATTEKQITPLATVKPVTHSVDGITPAHFIHARAARRCCFANFEPDIDGTVRRVALTEQHLDNVLSQLGFSVGCDVLGVAPDGFKARPGWLSITPRDPARKPVAIQVDERGRTLVPWVRGREWTKQFEHTPASAVLRLHDLRENLKLNRRAAVGVLQQVFESEFLPGFNELGKKVLAQRREVERQIELETLLGDAELASFYEQQLATIDEEADRGERRLRDFIGKQDEGDTPGDGTPARLADELVDDVVFYLGEIDRLRAANRRIEREISEMTTRLTRLFQGRICIVGYAATSLADMVPIPTHPRAPGVLAHANLLNGLLTGRLARWAPLWLNAAIAAAFGILMTLIATFMRARLALLFAAFMAVSYVAIAGALAFHQWTYWLALTPVVFAIVIVYVCISAYRYVFIEGERRQLATALGQYTSKEMARQMAENPELCRRAEMREVTAVFTDLKGFTSISERIGAERTQKVLNVCLGKFTEIMLRHEGMVNKFIGDGIFAFWNPVIYPQDDHARRACETAIDLLVGLKELKRDQSRRGGDEIFGEIILRVGIATGNAIVGPCGSEQKYDYTCIGDSVNVAARLESGNKFYGTRILISGDTRAGAGAGFEWRPLGGVQVKGKKKAVPIHELLGREGHVPEETLAYARDFGEAIAKFQRRDWKAALAAFESCHARRRDDLAAENYIEATQTLLENPPSEDWIGAIELKEK